MATSAYKGAGTLLKIGDAASPEVFTTIGEVVSIGKFGQRSDLLEVTHMGSTAKEYIGGLPDGAEVTFSCNYLPDNTQQTALVSAQSAGTAKNFKYVIPSGASGGSKTFSFSAIVLEWSIPTTTPNEPVHFEVSIKISGAITGPV